MTTRRKLEPLPILLSVDWDYFLPFCTDRKYDWGHGEGNPLFYEFMWGVRAMPWPGQNPKDNPFNAVRVDGKRVRDFWGKVLKPGLPVFACVADSHKTIAEFMKTVKSPLHVINFDAHHDCGYDQGTKHLDCATWGAVLRRQRKIKMHTLVYPEWRRREPENGEGKHPHSLVDEVIYGDWPHEPIAADFVFVCRSSCWMPSWCDQEWMDLRAGLLSRQPLSVMEQDYITKPREFTVPTLQEATT